MKTCIKNLFLLPALIAGLGLLPDSRARAQTFTGLHSFSATSGPYPSTNSDGAVPTAGLILSGSTLYGTADGGGSSGSGTVFKVKTDGTDFTTLYVFTATSGPYPSTNSDGANPMVRLVLSGNTLYGMTANGGRSGSGTVFAVNTDGTGFTNLHNFATASAPLFINSDGVFPQGVILSGNRLYGTASSGGGSGFGTIFAINTNGADFTILHDFANGQDGSHPKAELIFSDRTLYGTASGGGSWGYGTVFKVNADGSGFSILHSLTAREGGEPRDLSLSGDTLFGVASGGGSSGYGTVFKVNTDGTDFTKLHNFTEANQTSEGIAPVTVVLLGDTLYGTAFYGGNSGLGTVFKVSTDGAGFATLHNFTPVSGSDSGSTNSDGAYPSARLLLSGNTLYGAAYYGGPSGSGILFSLSLPPQLTIIRSEANIILTWPAEVAGFTLQSTTDLLSPAVWSTVSPKPVAVTGQNAVTNPVSSTRSFFRLTR